MFNVVHCLAIAWLDETWKRRHIQIQMQVHKYLGSPNLVEAQLDCRPGSEIAVGWKIRVTWSWKWGFKMMGTELGYSLTWLTKFSFWLSLWLDISISWHGGNELQVWYVLPTISSIRGPRWCWYSTEKCLPDSHLTFVYVVILSISLFWRIGETNLSTKTSKI